MKKILLITQKEFLRRIKSKSFLALSLIGPMIVIAFLFTAIWSGLGEVEKTNVLVSDPYQIFQEYLTTDTSANVEFYFIDDYVSNEDFLNKKMYEDFNIKVEVNEKILENATAVMTYKKLPSLGTEAYIKRIMQNNLEEMKALKFNYTTLEDYYKIKQPLQLIGYDARNGIYGQQKRESVMVGVFFGVLVFIFIFIFSIQVMRSVLEEKSNRVIEILASSVKSHQILIGKITGVALSGIIQFLIWFTFIFLALYVIRVSYFPDLYNPENWAYLESADKFTFESYGSIIELIYERIDFMLMLGIFVFYFLVGYFLYGSIYAALGGVVRSESDSQGFLITVSIPLFAALVFIFTLIFNSSQGAIGWMSLFPLTSPIVMPVRVAMGFEPGTAWELYMSMIILVISVLFVLFLSSKIYKRGILNYQHKIRLRTLMRWLKN